jgi:hypothetical protein
MPQTACECRMRMRIPLNERCASPAPPRTSQLLYSWGVVFNGVALWARDREAIATAGGLLQGYVPIVWLLIINNALVGLAISAILKFANNLGRVFAHTAAMLLTMFLECLLMSTPFSPQLVTSILIVSSSTFLYNLHPPPPPSTVAVRRGEPALLKAAKEDELANEPMDAPNGADGDATQGLEMGTSPRMGSSLGTASALSRS